MILYDNLWKVMKEKGVSQYALIKKHGISPAQITPLKRNESVSTHTIEMFCRILDCQVGDIMEYIKDDETVCRTRERSSFAFCRRQKKARHAPVSVSGLRLAFLRQPPS